MTLRFVIALAMIAAAIGASRHLSHGELVPPARSFSSFPIELKEWRGKEQYFAPEIYESWASPIPSFARTSGRTGLLFPSTSATTEASGGGADPFAQVLPAGRRLEPARGAGSADPSPFGREADSCG